MDFGICGKIALVAASSRGLGRAIAEELEAEGAVIVMCARRAGPLEEAAESIRRATGASVTTVAADVSTEAGRASFTNAAFETFGRVDILVNNSGGPPSGPFESLTAGMWDDAVRLLLTSVVELSRAVVPGMKERRWGRILNVTSIAAKQPVGGLMLSNSIRAAVTGFARTLADEVAPFGVTVNNILPGYTRTERVEELAKAIGAREGKDTGAAFAKWEAEIPMGHLGEPRDLAALAAFLASDRAGYITGSSIAVDGGWIRALM